VNACYSSVNISTSKGAFPRGPRKLYNAMWTVYNGSAVNRPVGRTDGDGGPSEVSPERTGRAGTAWDGENTVPGQHPPSPANFHCLQQTSSI
jgi:hypothetical protein